MSSHATDLSLCEIFFFFFFIFETATFAMADPTHLGKLEFALGAALTAVASRQLVQHGPAATTLVLVRVTRFVVRVFVGFPVVVRRGDAAPPSPAAARTCQLVVVVILVRVVVTTALPWRRRFDVRMTRVATGYVAVRRCNA